ncbi:MAG: NUDIX hydrolase [bacterium]|nr:NUDIX hydrolase [bacterium]
MIEIIVRAILVNEENKILLVRRVKEPEKEKWSLPGGKVKWRETAKKGIQREIKEELQLIFTPHYLFFTEYILPEKKLHSHVMYYDGKYSGTILAKDDEISELHFFSYSEVETLKNIAWNHREMILKYFNKIEMA